MALVAHSNSVRLHLLFLNACVHLTSESVSRQLAWSEYGVEGERVDCRSRRIWGTRAVVGQMGGSCKVHATEVRIA